MSYRDVLRIFKLERDLTDDETALLNTLRSMSESERELLAETLGPPVKAKSAKPATKKLKKCDVCNVSKRAVHHRDVNHPDYHKFDEGGPVKKSAHASSLSQAIRRTTGNNKPPQYGGFADDTDMVSDTRAPLLCDYSIDGKVCKGTVNDAIHDEGMGYAAYHPYQSAAHSAGSSLSTGESGVSSETGSEDVSVAAGG